MDFQKNAAVVKVDETHGIVYGWAIISTEGGQPYVDTQGDNISEASMLKAAVSFAKGSRTAKEMHEGASVGTILHVFPLTADIAKAMGLQTSRTGLMIGMKPDSPEVLAKFKSGEYRGFSIGGSGKRRKVTA